MTPLEPAPPSLAGARKLFKVTLGDDGHKGQ